MRDNQFGKQGWTPERLKDQKGKTFVITGANAGAGYQAARLLLSKGAEVVMLNRNPQKSEKAIADLKQDLGEEIKVSYIKMDLARLDSVRAAAQNVIEKVPHIDALICNAAIAQLATRQKTEHGFESQLGVNHYGHFLLLNLLFDKVEQTGKRIVVVGSNGYKMGEKRVQFEDINFEKNYNPMVTYGHSKLAQMVAAYELQRRIKKAGKDVKLYVCHPGASRTELGQDEANLFTKIMFKVMAYSPWAQSAEKGSWPEVMCATEEDLEELAYYGPTKRMDMVGAIGTCEMESHVLYETDAQKLWELSEEAVDCKWF